MPNSYARWDFRLNSIYLSNDALNAGCDAFEVETLRATIDNNGLDCNGDGAAYTEKPINKVFQEKTLEAYVSRESLLPGGGGTITIDSSYTASNDYTHRNFDGIVWGEKKINRWATGSESFRREVGGSSINTASAVEHLVIVYSNDNRITMYLNGAQYASQIKGSLITYNINIYRFVFCRRHHWNNDNWNVGTETFPGKILKAAIYDRALSANDVTLLYNNRDYTTGENVCIIGSTSSPTSSPVFTPVTQFCIYGLIY